MKKGKKIILILIILFLSIGFAYLSKELIFDGSIAFKKNTFRISIESVTDVSEGTTATVNRISSDTFSINGNLEKPDDEIIAFIKVNNFGDLDAKFVDYETTNLEWANDEKFDVKFTYGNDRELKKGDSLKSGYSMDIYFIVKFNELNNEDQGTFNYFDEGTIKLNFEYAAGEVNEEKYDYKGFDYEHKEGYIITKYFTAPEQGRYKIEAWGAQGGSAIVQGNLTDLSYGGYGGYSTGVVYLNAKQQLSIVVGGQGGTGTMNVVDTPGGYNGGGISHWDEHDNEASGGGGGATHVALSGSGLLSSLENNLDNLLIVAGGGGGAAWSNTGGHAGGFKAPDIQLPELTLGGSQTSGYAFGRGGDGDKSEATPGGGGGAGFYGGFGGRVDVDMNAVPGAGGSSYIGNPLLTDKYMACYDCETSDAYEEKTISVSVAKEIAVRDAAKKGNGYVKISYLGE